MFQRTARVIEHVPVAERTFRVRLECPEIAGAIRRSHIEEWPAERTPNFERLSHFH